MELSKKAQAVGDVLQSQNANANLELILLRKNEKIKDERSIKSETH